jgi:hypothetical protein
MVENKAKQNNNNNKTPRWGGSDEDQRKIYYEGQSWERQSTSAHLWGTVVSFRFKWRKNWGRDESCTS